MSKMYKNIVLILIFCSGIQLYSQQDAQYTQYMYNTMTVNPAYAGSRGMLSIAALHRSQWVGLDGAPQTQTLNIHSPMGRLNKVGMGLSIVNDKIGPIQETSFDVDFSYTIKTSDEGKLSFGVKGGGHLLDIKFSELNQYKEGGTDPLLETDIQNKFSPNVGAGIYYHTDKFYVGISAPNLLETKHFSNSNFNDTSGNSVSILAAEKTNYYIIGGYVFELNPDLLFKPAILTKMVTGAPVQVDVSASFLLREKLSLGLAYRWSAAFSAFAGFQASESFMVGIAYDREITELGNAAFNNGSFEVFLRFDFIRYLDNILTPRFF